MEPVSSLCSSTTSPTRTPQFECDFGINDADCVWLYVCESGRALLFTIVFGAWIRHKIRQQKQNISSGIWWRQNSCVRQAHFHFNLLTRSMRVCRCLRLFGGTSPGILIYIWTTEHEIFIFIVVNNSILYQHTHMTVAHLIELNMLLRGSMQTLSTATTKTATAKKEPTVRSEFIIWWPTNNQTQTNEHKREREKKNTKRKQIDHKLGTRNNALCCSIHLSSSPAHSLWTGMKLHWQLSDAGARIVRQKIKKPPAQIVPLRTSSPRIYMDLILGFACFHSFSIQICHSVRAVHNKASAVDKWMERPKRAWIRGNSDELLKKWLTREQRDRAGERERERDGIHKKRRKK